MVRHAGGAAVFSSPAPAVGSPAEPLSTPHTVTVLIGLISLFTYAALYAGGTGVGGLLEGEPRSSDTAWANYQAWIYSRAARAAVLRAPRGSAPGIGAAWSVELAFDFDPLLPLPGGGFYNGSAPVTLGLNVALGDADAVSAGDPVYGLRHEMWWAGVAACPEGGNCHTLRRLFGDLVLEPGARPPSA